MVGHILLSLNYDLTNLLNFEFQLDEKIEEIIKTPEWSWPGNHGLLPASFQFFGRISCQLPHILSSSKVKL